MLNVAERLKGSPGGAEDAVSQADDYGWLPVGYRVVPGWSCYVLSTELDLWSMARIVPGKGGNPRQLSAKQIKPSDDDRVTLSQAGQKQSFHLNELRRQTFPELSHPQKIRHQTMCRHGHPLIQPMGNALITHRLAEPRVATWGSGNRVCLWCSSPAGHTDTYSRHSGIYGRAYHGLPVRVLRDRHLIHHVASSEHGFRITEKP